MKFLLLLLLLVGNNALESNSMSIQKFPNLMSKSAKIHCQKITGYYNGTFQDPDKPSMKFDGQLQINAEIRLTDNRFYFKISNFSRQYAENYYINLYNGYDTANCETAQKGECSIPFSRFETFYVYFWPYHYSGYPLDILNIYRMLDKKFTLLNAIGNCAPTLQNNAPLSTNPDLVKSCFCCGDEYKPDPALNCPTSSWN